MLRSALFYGLTVGIVAVVGYVALHFIKKAPVIGPKVAKVAP